MKLVNIHKPIFTVVIWLLTYSSISAQVWSLEQCIDSATAHNKNLLMSRNNMAIGEQRQKEAKANLIPKLTANADYKYFINLPYQLMPLSTFNAMAPEGQFIEAQFGVPHNINANLQLALPLYNPQLYGGIEASKIASELSELQYKKTAEQIYFEIANLYYNAQLLHHQLDFIDSNLTNAEKLLKNIELLKEQSLAKGTDVSKVGLQIAQLNTQKIAITSKYTQVLNSLKFAMGTPPETSLTIDPNIQLDNISESSPSTNLDVDIVHTQKKLLRTELSTLNKSRFLPALNLVGSYGTTGFGYDKKPNGFIKFFPIGFAGIQLSYPLFNGTVTQRKINQKKIELQNNELQTNLLNEQNNMQIENATLQRFVTQKSAATSGEQIALATTIYTQTMLQQKQGTASLNDVLLSDNALREAQQLYLAAIVDYLKAELELKKLTGKLSTKH